jgi:phosphatidylglycerophosphate synthase
MQKLITPNRVTAIRVAIAILAVAMYAIAPREYAFSIGVAGVSLTFLAVVLDGLDGFLARRFHLASAIGAQLDILGDRVLENLFFTFFAVCGEISLWVPLFFFIRGAITDFLRGVAAARTRTTSNGESEMRRNWFLESRWGKAIVASRSSRFAYGAVKCACFCALGMEWMLRRMDGAPSADVLLIVSGVNIALVATAAAFCILRALPVLWEGRLDILRAPRADSRVLAGDPKSIREMRALGNSAHHVAAR